MALNCVQQCGQCVRHRVGVVIEQPHIFAAGRAGMGDAQIATAAETQIYVAFDQGIDAGCGAQLQQRGLAVNQGFDLGGIGLQFDAII